MIIVMKRVIITVIMMKLLTSSSSRPVVREKLACGSIEPSVSEGKNHNEESKERR